MERREVDILHGAVIWLGMCNPSGQNQQKTVRRRCFFVNSALKIQCYIVNS